jgi:hypothetical protein
MRPALAVAASTLLVTAAYVGCASVPDIRFVGDSPNTGDDGGDASTDGATAADGDGGSDGAVVRDAAPACTTASPGGGATCCGTVWCIGDCSSANCDDCANRGCQTGEFCCGKTGNVLCKTRCP